MSFESFLQNAWSDHGDHPAEVAERLERSTALIETADHVGAMARIVTHVFGEHLAAWQRGMALLQALRNFSVARESAAARAALDRSVAALRYGSGDGAAIAALSNDDRAWVLATTACAFAAQGEIKRALTTFTSAVASAEAGLQPGSPAARALAVGGNNLAAMLEEKRDRDAVETAAMMAAAQAGLRYWKLAGTWLEEERAEYRLARSFLQGGDPTSARAAAERCVAICDTHDAPPLEQFFAFAALAIASRAAGDRAGFDRAHSAALTAYASVPADEQSWCAAEFRELAASAAQAAA